MANKQAPSDNFEAVRTLELLWKAWTMPASASPYASYPDGDKKKARHWALIAVVFLTFALRGMQDASSLALAGLAAASLAIALDMASRSLKDKLDENILMSGYTTLAVLMFVVICTRVLAGNTNLYLGLQDLFSSWFFGGSVLVPIVLAIVPTCMAWLVKAKFWDGNDVGGSEVVYSALVTGAGGVAVAIVSLLSDTIFSNLLSIASHSAA